MERRSVDIQNELTLYFELDAFLSAQGIPELVAGDSRVWLGLPGLAVCRPRNGTSGGECRYCPMVEFAAAGLCPCGCGVLVNDYVDVHLGHECGGE